MKHFTMAFALIASLSAPANAFSMDSTLPTLTFPEPTEPSQSCVSPADISTTACSTTE